MTDHPVTLIGGPGDGDTVMVDEPWPRYGSIYVTVGLEQHAYLMDPSGADTADYVDPAAVDGGDSDTAGGEGEPGPTGPTGPPGPIGDTGPAGEDGQSVTHQGDWDPDTTYQAVDIVTYDDIAWLSKTDLNTGNQPDISPSNWDALSFPGPPGEGGGETYEQSTEPVTSTIGAIWIVQNPA